jgi:hypothetical protein
MAFNGGWLFFYSFGSVKFLLCFNLLPDLFFKLSQMDQMQLSLPDELIRCVFAKLDLADVTLYAIFRHFIINFK